MTASRSELLNQVQQQADRAWAQLGGACLVGGPAGSGKTHFVTSLLGRLPEGTTSLIAGGAPTGSPALWPICDAIGSAGVGRLRDEVHAVLEQYAETVPVVRQVLGPLVGARKITRLGRAFAKDTAPGETHTFAALVELLRSLSGRYRLVFFLDDIHWLDESSIAFVGHLLRELGRLPIFVLLATRTNGAEGGSVRAIRDAFGRVPGNVAVQVEIPVLDYLEVEALVAEYLGGRVTLSEEDVEWLHSSSRGTPKYLTDLLAVLRSRGLLQESKGHWQLSGRPQSLVVPRSLAALIQARLQHVLERIPEVGPLLDLAAVYGQRFDLRVLADVVGISRTRCLRVLERVGTETSLVRRIGTSVDFEFDHDLTREAVLSGLGAMVADLHSTLADRLASNSKVAAIKVAYHYRNAGRFDSAGKYYEIAWRVAGERYCHNAASSYSRSWDETLSEAGLSSRAPERVRAVEAWAESLIASERYEEAAALLTERLATKSLPRTVNVLQLLARSSSRLPSGTKHQETVLVLREALRRVDHDTSPAVAARLLTDLVHAYDAVGNYAASQTAFRHAYTLANKSQDTALILKVMRLSCIFWQPGRVREILLAAVKLAQKHRLDYERALCLNNLGTCSFALADLDKAKEYYTWSHELLRTLGGYRLDTPMNNLGLIHLVRGDTQDAENCFSSALRASRETESTIFIRSNIAVRMGMSGRLSDAIGQFRQLVSEADATGDIYYRDTMRYNLAAALLKHGTADEAAEVVTGCKPHRSRSDDALIAGRRARLELDANRVLGRPDDEGLLEAVKVLERTTKPQAWLYRYGWYLADIEFWWS